MLNVITSSVSGQMVFLIAASMGVVPLLAISAKRGYLLLAASMLGVGTVTFLPGVIQGLVAVEVGVVLVAGTFLFTAARGHQQVTQLKQRAQERGGVPL